MSDDASRPSTSARRQASALISSASRFRPPGTSRSSSSRTTATAARRRHPARRGAGRAQAARLVGHRRHRPPRVQRPTQGRQGADRPLAHRARISWIDCSARSCACSPGPRRRRTTSRLPVICSKWAALRPEERWWLFAMTVAEAGLPDDTQRGWRRALFLALSDGEKPAPGRKRRRPVEPDLFSPAAIQGLMNERRRHAVLPEGCARAHRAAAAGAEALGRGLQGADGGQRQDAHRARQLLERPQAAHPEQGLHPRLPAAGDRRSGARPGDLREADGAWTTSPSSPAGSAGPSRRRFSRSSRIARIADYFHRRPDRRPCRRPRQSTGRSPSTTR